MPAVCGPSKVRVLWARAEPDVTVKLATSNNTNFFIILFTSYLNFAVCYFLWPLVCATVLNANSLRSLRRELRGFDVDVTVNSVSSPPFLGLQGDAEVREAR